MPTADNAPTALSTSQGAVTSDHFGSNFLFDQDDATQGSWYDTVTDAAHTQTLRFPGGTLTETQFDPQDPQDLAKLDTFLQYCASNGHAAMIFLPTHIYFDPAAPNSIDPAAQSIIQTYVDHVMSLAAANGVTIQGFEIGNEYYQSQFTWSVSQFAELQAQMASWVHDEIGNAADIFIQSGRDLADNQILRDVFFASATDDLDITDIDGILTHLYFGATGQNLTRIGAVKNRLEMLDDVWGGDSLETIVTEWNASEAENYGGASAVYGFVRFTVLTRGFADFIGYGADQLMLWSTIASGTLGRSTLGLQDEFGPTTLLPTGYWYRLMATELIDTNLVSEFGGDAAFEDSTVAFA